jgi:hypothetical protein
VIVSSRSCWRLSFDRKTSQRRGVSLITRSHFIHHNQLEARLVKLEARVDAILRHPTLRMVVNTFRTWLTNSLRRL